MTRAITITSLLFMLQACASSTQAVQVKGPDQEVVKLAGQWEGSYEGNESGRIGTINFDLAVGRHTAEGKVIMYADGAGHKARPLRIKFVAVKGSEIRGRIEPYRDPACKCEVRTEFQGTLEGNSIGGTFITHLPKLQRKHTGNWSVHRK
jgi:hypothetical protein